VRLQRYEYQFAEEIGRKEALRLTRYLKLEIEKLRRQLGAQGAVVRDDRPFADAYSGYNELYGPARSQGPITAALCWAHARRQFFELADIAANDRRGKSAAAISPIALEAVTAEVATLAKSRCRKSASKRPRR
jgi:hypothetical protein